VSREAKACRLCAKHLPFGPKPVFLVGRTARLLIVGQAPGRRVHETGVPWNDPSGDRLRAWLQLAPEVFYDQSRIAIVPMGFCFPGYDESGSDKPPRPECVRTWHDRLFGAAPRFALTLAIGTYAQKYHLKGGAKKTMTQTVRAWREYGQKVIPLPHPSWRNTGWLKKNPWFETELLPDLRKRVARVLSSAR